MRGSGKQLLLQVLYELSTHPTKPEDLGRATELLRTVFLVHGSTSDESFDHVSRLKWGTSPSGRRQGIMTRGGVLISDVWETIRELPGLRDFVLARHPELSPEDYEAAEHAIWLVVSAVQMFEELNAVEVDEDLDIDGWVDNMMAKYDYHFRERGQEPPE